MASLNVQSLSLPHGMKFMPGFHNIFTVDNNYNLSKFIFSILYC